MRVLTVIQACSFSTRLPGKAYLKIAGKTMLEHVHAAASAAIGNAWPVTVAVAKDDKEMHRFCVTHKMHYTLGPRKDLLTNFELCVRALAEPPAHPPTHVLRLTADCPMLQPRHIMQLFHQVSLRWPGSGPPDLYVVTNRPYDNDGYDMELFSVGSLQLANSLATVPEDREHVCPWMYRHFNVVRLPIITWGDTYQSTKLSVDTQEDFDRVRALMEGDKE